MRRRDFLARVALGGTALGGAAIIAAPRLAGQVVTPPSGDAAPAQGTTSNLFDMNQEAAKTVRRPAKPGAVPSMTEDVRDALEHDIRCQCSCTLDVYTCRTTDFSCQVSPAMHRDVMSLVDGGYSAQEILDAFVQTYGERALMSPKREGFNWAGYLVPSFALAAGAAGLVTVLRGMQRRTAAIAAERRGDSLMNPPTPEEHARLQAAIRRDD